MSFTPGPWTIHPETGHIVSNNTVLSVSGISLPMGYIPEDDVSYANRNLIAAAPEMYEALKALHSTALRFGGCHSSEYLSGYRQKPWTEMMDALTIALTALAKAESRKP